jgi:signal transduction histidine kinase
MAIRSPGATDNEPEDPVGDAAPARPDGSDPDHTGLGATELHETEPDTGFAGAGFPDPGLDDPGLDHTGAEAAGTAGAWRERLSRLANAPDGSETPENAGTLEDIDLIAAFRSTVLAIRWGTTAVCVALAASSIRSGDAPILLWGLVVVGYTVLRTVRPIRYTGDVRSLVTVLAEVALLLLTVSMTGYWDSPYVFSLLTAIIVAGFARGFGFGIRIGVVCAVAVSIPHLIRPGAGEDEFRLAAQWSVSLVLIGLVAGYARRISGEADRQHSLALDRLGRLADANALLFSLHRVTQTLPASLEMGDVLDNTMSRLKGLFDFDTAAILLMDDTDTTWDVIRKEGVRLPVHLNRSDMPTPMSRALATSTTLAVDDLQGGEGPGLSGRAGSGMYAVLTARGAVIGMLALESRREKAYAPRDLELLRGFIEPVALAIDNARWFSRLRTVGADEERTRIARDLHDRIGQSLAYLAFELDRIVGKHDREEDVGVDLEQLRGDVRGVIGEVRDTLYDLRTDVSEQQGIAQVLDSFSQRVRERTGLDIELVCDGSERLPILQEREMWRIAQEAVANAERHAQATRVTITWRCNEQEAVLEVSDNGRGFPIGKAGRIDSYGILGMRERASSIGATLDLLSAEGRGTTVRCQLRGV